MADNDRLISLALALLEDWRLFLLEVRDDHPRAQRPDIDEDGEALGRFIDTMASVTFDFLLEQTDEDLSCAIRLIFELDQVLNVVNAGVEGDIVRDALSAGMMNLASVMRRGHNTTLPKVRLR